MAVLLRDPLVADNIREIDLADADGPEQARRLFEGGYLVILRNQRFDLDYAFLDTLDFDRNAPAEIAKQIKKYGDRYLHMMVDTEDPAERFVIDTVFDGDAGKFGYFQEQLRAGNAQSDALYARIFPRYQAYRKIPTWRLTRTMYENVHWDNFHIPGAFQQVRIFTNLERTPRLWRTSHSVDDYADTVYAAEGLARFADQLGDDLNTYLNRTLGDMKRPCLDRLPTHHLAFEQGDVWICETRIIAHQIYAGGKAVGTMYFNDPAEMDNADDFYEMRIARLHARHAVSGHRSLAEVA